MLPASFLQACKIVTPKLEEDVEKLPRNEIEHHSQYDKVQGSYESTLEGYPIQTWNGSGKILQELVLI